MGFLSGLTTIRTLYMALFTFSLMAKERQTFIETLKKENLSEPSLCHFELVLDKEERPAIHKI